MPLIIFLTLYLLLLIYSIFSSNKSLSSETNILTVTKILKALLTVLCSAYMASITLLTFLRSDTDKMKTKLNIYHII